MLNPYIFTGFLGVTAPLIGHLLTCSFSSKYILVTLHFYQLVTWHLLQHGSHQLLEVRPLLYSRSMLSLVLVDHTIAREAFSVWVTRWDTGYNLRQKGGNGKP